MVKCINVFKMDDCEWWASKWIKEKTLEYYMKEYGLTEKDVTIKDIEESNLDSEGMWWETTEPDDIKRLGDADEIVGCEVINGRIRKKVRFGDLMRRGAEVYKFIPFREALEKYGDFTEPFCLASTEW